MGPHLPFRRDSMGLGRRMVTIIRQGSSILYRGGDFSGGPSPCILQGKESINES